MPPGRGPAFLDRITQNGLFVGVTAMLVSVPLFLPLTVGVVAGDTVAGEAGLGTLRYLLVAPAGRVRLLLVKYAGAVASPSRRRSWWRWSGQGSERRSSRWGRSRCCPGTSIGAG